FDTLSWREPAETSAPSATGTELLPLIVGSPASATDPAMSGEVIDEEPTTARAR
ncbi:heme biosynthesis protein HemY, partial [Cereibacter changlensis]